MNEITGNIFTIERGDNWVLSKMAHNLVMLIEMG